jgi:hypothetical protein
MAKYIRYGLEVTYGELDETEKKHVKTMLKKDIPIAFNDDIQFQIVNVEDGISEFKIGRKQEGKKGRPSRTVKALIAPIKPKK